MGRIPLEELTGEASDSVQKYALSYIRPYHREIARRLVLGQTQAEVARDLNISPSRLSIICNSPVMKNEVARLEAQRDSGVHDVTVQLQELAPTMIENIERIALYSNSDKVRLAAAQDLLDRNRETSKVTKTDNIVTHETHEERLARLMGIRPDEVYAKEPDKDKVIDITPSAQTVSDSNGNGDLEGDADAREGSRDGN